MFVYMFPFRKLLWKFELYVTDNVLIVLVLPFYELLEFEVKTYTERKSIK